MQNDYFEQKREKIAASLIKRYKANESKVLAEYGSRETFFFQVMADELWRDAKIRHEFQGNKENLKSFLENESRVQDHKAGITRHKKPETIPDDAPADTAIKNRWLADPALQNEFNGDYDAYRSWHANRHKVRVYNR